MWWTNAALTVSLYTGAARRMRSSAPQPARLMILGCAVEVVGPVGAAWAPAPPSAAAPPLASLPAPARDPLPADGASTRSWISFVPASSHWPSL